MQNKLDLRNMLGDSMSLYTTIFCGRIHSRSEGLQRLLLRYANERPFGILTCANGAPPTCESAKHSYQIVKQLKHHGLRSYALAGGFIAKGERLIAKSIVTEGLYLTIMPLDRGIREFFDILMSTAESLYLRSFVFGLPNSFDYAAKPIDRDGLQAGHIYSINPTFGASVIGHTFGDQTLNTYRVQALADHGIIVEPQYWQWFGVTTPQNHIEAMGYEASGLDWLPPRI